MHLSVLLFLGCMLAAVRADSSGSGSGSSYNDDDNVTFSALHNALQNDVGVSAFTLEPDDWYDGPYLYSNCGLTGYDRRSFEEDDHPFESCRDFASKENKESFHTFKINPNDNRLQCDLAGNAWSITSDCNNPRLLNTEVSHLVLRPRYRRMFEKCSGYHEHKIIGVPMHTTSSEQMCVELCDDKAHCLAFATCNTQGQCGDYNCILYSVFDTVELAGIVRCWQDQDDVTKQVNWNLYDKKYYRYDNTQSGNIATKQTVFPYCRARQDAAINSVYLEDADYKQKGRLEYKMSKTKCEAYCNTMPDCVGITWTSYQCLFLRRINLPSFYTNIECGGPFEESFKDTHTYTENAFLTTDQLLPESTNSAVIGYGIPIILTCPVNNEIISITSATFDPTFDPQSSCNNAINTWLKSNSYCNSQNDCSVFCNQVNNQLLCRSDQSETQMSCSYSNSDSVEMTVDYDCVSSTVTVPSTTQVTTRTATTTKLGEESSYVMYKFIGCTGSGDLVTSDASSLDACFDECREKTNCKAVMFEDGTCRLYQSGTVSSDNCYDTSSNGDGTLYLRPYFEYKKDDSAGTTEITNGTRERFATVSQCATKCFDTPNCLAITTKEQVSEPKFECILYSSIQSRDVPDQKATWYDLKYFGRSGTQTIFVGCRGQGYRRLDGTLTEKDTIIGMWEEGYHLNQRSDLITKGACEAYCNTVPECKAVTLSNKQCLMHNTTEQTPVCDKGNRDKQSMYYVKEAFSTSNQLTTKDMCTGIRGRDGVGTPVGITCQSNEVIDTVNAVFSATSNLEACPESTVTADTCDKKLQIFTETCCKGKQHCYLRCLNQELNTCFCINTGATYTLDAACTASPYYGINGVCVLPPAKSPAKKKHDWDIVAYVAAGACAGVGLIFLIVKCVNSRSKSKKPDQKPGDLGYNFTQMFQL
jgi:hypothetical protein